MSGREALSMRRSVVIALVLFLLVVVLFGGPSLLTSPSTSEITPEQEDNPELVYLEDSESGFWEYMNVQESFEERSPINIIVRGDHETIVQVMQDETDSEWTETDEVHEDADPETFAVDATDETVEREDSETLLPTETEWAAATGTTRYAYLNAGDGSEGEWVTETLQLDDGDYYGARYHIRLYETPNESDEWTVMQGHTEHFDWFTLRHRVDGVEAAQSSIEADFMGLPQTDEREDVSRIYLGNDDPSDSDGWATHVDLTMIALSSVFLSVIATAGASVRVEQTLRQHLTRTDWRRLQDARARITTRHLLLFGTIVGLLLGVRFGGIALERHVSILSMHAIAAALYPIIALGIPVATYVIASSMERRIDSAVTATLALSIGIWLDYGYLGVAVLPIDVVIQRMLVTLSLGLIAGGAAERATRDSRWNELLLVGTAGWCLALLGTLLGYL
jgi:hypothetical protein